MLRYMILERQSQSHAKLTQVTDNPRIVETQIVDNSRVFRVDLYNNFPVSSIYDEIYIESRSICRSYQSGALVSSCDVELQQLR